jgi:hypothetical protein
MKPDIHHPPLITGVCTHYCGYYYQKFPLWDNTLLHNILSTYNKSSVYSRSAQIQAISLPVPLHFIQWHPTVVLLQYGTCFMSPLWLLDFWKICAPLVYGYTSVDATVQRAMEQANSL